MKVFWCQWNSQFQRCWWRSGRVYVVAAEMSFGDVEPSVLATVVRWHHLINPWGRKQSGKEPAESFDDNLSSNAKIAEPSSCSCGCNSVS